MMARVKKESTPMSVRMDTAIFERLEGFCKESGQSKTFAIERAVNKYIDEYEEQMKKLQKLGKLK